MSSQPRNHCDPDGKEFDLTGTLHRQLTVRAASFSVCLIKASIHWKVSCACLDLSACTGTNAQHAEIIPAQSFHASIQVFKMLGAKKITAKCLTDAPSGSHTRSVKLYCSSRHAVLCVFHVCSNHLSCSPLVYSLSSFTVEDTGCRYALVYKGGAGRDFNPFAPVPACLSPNPSVSNGSKYSADKSDFHFT